MPETRYNIAVKTAIGTDLTNQFVNHPAIDGWSSDDSTGCPDNGLDSLSGLTASQAQVCLGQIIDQGHEWGENNQPWVDALYSIAEAIVERGSGSFTVPDGYIVGLTSETVVEDREHTASVPAFECVGILLVTIDPCDTVTT